MPGLLPVVIGCLIVSNPGPEPTLIEVDRDNVLITESCRVRITADCIPDPDSNGVIQIAGEEITVEFLDTPLRGARPDQAPDTYSGVGVRVEGTRVTVTGLKVSGYKVGIHGQHTQELTINHCDVSDNFRQRLRSTPQREDPSDWLRPHANDDNEWMHNYGAGIYVEDSTRAWIHDNYARRVQNGIILDRVGNSNVYDNDCSFLSGWGLALWRASRIGISRNAFDFCIRGYSHGVYNRGQDSAGILLFEQCEQNRINNNSATHCGDGVFSFAGREALGEINPKEDRQWYKRRGNSNTLVMNNDFSYAAAHGIEITFSFNNRIYSNRLVENAICGIWGGYSCGTYIAVNRIEGNGELGYGLERGGINIEHGQGNRIFLNQFENNKCGIHLWWDNDEAILQTPWAKLNGAGCAGNQIIDNSFKGDDIAIHLRTTGGVTEIGRNRMTDVGKELEADEDSPTVESDNPPMVFQPPMDNTYGDKWPVGQRRHLRGRENIIMTEWGPYDWEEPLLLCDGLQLDEESGRPFLSYRVLGGEDVEANPITISSATGKLLIEKQTAPATGVLHSVRIAAANQGLHQIDATCMLADGRVLTDSHLLVQADWEIRHFASPADPREDEQAWRKGASGATVSRKPVLNERYGMGGPGGDLPADHFGTVATTSLTFPAGTWKLITNSDDGIRVFLDGEPVIDDWTWHSPRTHEYTFTIDGAREIPLRVEHFELDGYSILSLDIEAVQ